MNGANICYKNLMEENLKEFGTSSMVMRLTYINMTLKQSNSRPFGYFKTRPLLQNSNELEAPANKLCQFSSPNPAMLPLFHFLNEKQSLLSGTSAPACRKFSRHGANDDREPVPEVYCSITTTPVPTLQQQHWTICKKITSSLSPIPHIHLTWPHVTSFFSIKSRSNSRGSRLLVLKMLEISPRAPFPTYLSQRGLEPLTVGLNEWSSACELRVDTSKNWNR